MSVSDAMSAPRRNIGWLGNVPAEWPLKRLKYFVEFRGGGTPSKEDASYWGGDIPWISPKDMKADQVTDSAERITDKGLRESSTQLIPAGAVLIVVRSGILRHTLPVAVAGRDVAINQDMKALIPGPEIDPFYLKYVIIGRQQSLLLDWTKAGATVESVEHELVANTVFAIPPHAEQRAIVDFLDEKTAAIDTLIAKKERLIDSITTYAHTLLGTVVRRGLDPDTPQRDSGIPWLGTVPAHWKVARIKHTARMESGHTPDRKVPAYWESGTIPWVSLKDTRALASADFITETAECTTEEGLAHSSARLLPAGAVVFTRDATVGLAAITTRPMAVSQHLIAWICGPEILPKYLLRVIDAMKDELERLTWGATIKTIGMPDITEMVTPVPPLAEQARIVAHLDGALRAYTGEKALVQRQIRMLREYRRTLISAAVTCQIDVRREVSA